MERLVSSSGKLQPFVSRLPEFNNLGAHDICKHLSREKLQRPSDDCAKRVWRTARVRCPYVHLSCPFLFFLLPYRTVPSRPVPSRPVPYRTVHCPPLPFPFLPFPSLPFHSIPFLSCPVLSFPFLSFPFLSFPHHTTPHHTTPKSKANKPFSFVFKCFDGFSLHEINKQGSVSQSMKNMFAIKKHCCRTFLNCLMYGAFCSKINLTISTVF